MSSFPADPIFYGAAAIAALILFTMLRRLPLIGLVLRLLGWGAVALLLVGALRDRSLLDPGFARVGQYLGLSDNAHQSVSGRTLKIPMSGDGHFWVVADIDGVERRLLVDSGATLTALSVSTVAAAGLHPLHSPFPVLLRTANGTVAAKTFRVATLRMGNVVARNLPVVVSPAFGDTEVIGMNFLSRLKSWRVEGRTLILEPHHSILRQTSASTG